MNILITASQNMKSLVTLVEAMQTLGVDTDTLDMSQLTTIHRAFKKSLVDNIETVSSISFDDNE